jgi:hypothetical protein
MKVERSQRWAKTAMSALANRLKTCPVRFFHSFQVQVFST